MTSKHTQPTVEMSAGRLRGVKWSWMLRVGAVRCGCVSYLTMILDEFCWTGWSIAARIQRKCWDFWVKSWDVTNRARRTASQFHGTCLFVTWIVYSWFPKPTWSWPAVGFIFFVQSWWPLKVNNWLCLSDGRRFESAMLVRIVCSACPWLKIQLIMVWDGFLSCLKTIMVEYECEWVWYA